MMKNNNKYKLDRIRKTLKLYNVSEQDINDFIEQLGSRSSKQKLVEGDEQYAKKA